MTDFTKTKMHFALALLGTLFALHPFVEKVEDWGFEYLGYYLKVFYVYALIAGLLALTVYCFALALLSERPSSWAERTGNYAYGLAAMVLPLYGALYLTSLLGAELKELSEEWAWAARAAQVVPLALGVVWFLASWLVAWRLRRRLSEQDRSAKIRQLAEQEITALDRAPELFDSRHYDLSVIEAWKAIEARLRRVLLLHRINVSGENPQEMIDKASRRGLIHEKVRGQLQELRRQWKIAVGTEPLTREAAESALRAARDILSTIPVEELDQAGKPAL
jgi:HEPN domain-containing protein